MTPEETRDTAVRCAEAVVGLDANPEDAERRTDYLELIAPGETPSVASQMATMSGCGLVVAGIWRAMGLHHEELEAPYRLGTAISRLMSIALGLGAWRGYKLGRVPAPGDMVLVGGSAGGVEHVYTVVQATPQPDGTVRLRSVDGGQRDALSFQTILAKERLWKSGRDYPTSASDPGGSGSAGRGIAGFIDVSTFADYLPDVEAPEPAPTPPGGLSVPVRPRPRFVPRRPGGLPTAPSQPVRTPGHLTPAPSGLWSRLRKPISAGEWAAHWASLRIPSQALVEDPSLRVLDPRLLPAWYLVGVHAAGHPLGDSDYVEPPTRFRPWPNLRQVVRWRPKTLDLSAIPGRFHPTPREPGRAEPVSPETPAGPAWQDFAAGSGKPEAGHALSPAVVAALTLARSLVPPEPGMVATNAMRGGHMYIGKHDAEHVEYLHSYLTARGVGVGRVERMKVEAFRSLLFREGTTAAINTYDNMIVTWGLGYGGKGQLPLVVDRMVVADAVTDLFASLGIRYDGAGTWSVADLAGGSVVSGKDPALEVLRASVPLLHGLIHCSRGPATRDVVTEAQLDVFMERSAEHAGADEIATQALFNFVTHLKHWAPAYAMGAIPWALSQVGLATRDPARDRALAPQIGRYFYGRAQKYPWQPAFSQFKQYVTHMAQDGLDVSADPWLRAAAPTDLPDV
jgi:hypothetical protein